MKVQRESQKFSPITITIESETEAKVLVLIALRKHFKIDLNCIIDEINKGVGNEKSV